jgi:uncharacterized protein
MSNSANSGYLNLLDIPSIAVGLNIEGYRPTLCLPQNCQWYNIVQVIDEPLSGLTFNTVMNTVKQNNYQFIEQAVGINIDIFLEQLITFINNIAKQHKHILIHVHQYTGSTKLADVIQQKTSIKTILDKTHFYEHPVIYTDLYPTIDALISISQCAGFGINAGQWIIPSAFMEFDVLNNIIYTKKTIVNNNAADYFPYDYITGNILMVNDLWNPDLKNDDGILLFDELDTRVLEFVKKETQIFDESHNWKHALCVARNATRILNNKHVLYLALLHDVCDHKYPNSIPRKELSHFIQVNIPKYKEIDELIELISFSKQKKDDISNPILDAVRDGDRLEAIGEIGIKRCKHFTLSRGGKVPEDVIIHCYEKLLRILPERYIVTHIGRDLAIPKHNTIVKYVLENLPKTTLNYVLPEYIST